MNSKHHILIIYSLKSSFVRQDIDALKANYIVSEYEFGIQRELSQAIAQFRLLFFLIRNASKYVAIYTWFADYHSLLPAILTRIFKFKLILAIGGFDAAKIKELGYGVHINFIRSKIVKYAVRKAHFIIFSSKFTYNQLVKNTNVRINRNRYEIIYPGIHSKFNRLIIRDIKYLMIYVAAGDSINRMKVKGVDRFLELAKKMTDFQFLLIGPDGAAAKWVMENKSDNVSYIKSIEREELFQYYEASKFIALFSRFEAFGMVLLEGISAGCKPITLSNLGSEEIVNQFGDFGKVFNTFDSHEISEYLKSYSSSDGDFADIQYYLNKFPDNKRAERINNFLSQV